jgi:hypothetical protein
MAVIPREERPRDLQFAGPATATADPSQARDDGLSSDSVTGWRLPWILFRQLFVDPFGVLSLLLTAHLVLLIGSIVGLYRLSPWGFYYVYVMIPFSTILLSVSSVPFVPRLIPFPLGAIVMMVLNLAVLAVTRVAHVRYLRGTAGERRVGAASQN